MTVVDPAAARAAVAAGSVCCPQEDCEGTLRVWSKCQPTLRNDRCRRMPRTQPGSQRRPELLCASLLIASGASDVQVAAEMGHSRVETTKNIYGHLFLPRLTVDPRSHELSREPSSRQ